MQLMPGFGGRGAISVPAPPPPPPTREDPSVSQAKENLRLSTLKRRGRAAAILTPPDLGDELGAGTVYSRPQARAASVLGG